MCRVHHAKCRAGWSTSWNQHWCQKYQQPQICRWHHPYGRKEEDLKSLLMKKKEEWKCWLRTQHSKNEDHDIWSHYFMANRWGNNGNSHRLYFLGLQITADGDCSHEIKRLLLLGRKSMTNIDSILKNRDTTLPAKVCLVKAMGFPVVMYGCESWTIKKTERQRTDAFELWCWRRLLWVPWTARRSNQFILKEISPEHSLEGLTLKLKLLYFLWSPNVKNWLIWKDPDGGKDWRQEEKGATEDEMVGWHHRLDGHAFEQALGVGVGQGSLACCSPWYCKESDVTERLNWTELDLLF